MRDDDPDNPMYGRNCILEHIEAEKSRKDRQAPVSEASIPSFSQCSSCGSVPMLLVKDQPVRCFSCGAVRK